jgi:hypothetical protein
VEYDGAGREISRQTIPLRLQDARRPDPRRLAFTPSHFVTLSGLITSPAEFAVIAGTKQSLMAEARGKDGTAVPVLLALVFFPTQFFLPNIGSIPNTPDDVVIGFTLTTVLSSLLCGLACLLAARRCALSRIRCVGWALFGLVCGVMGLLVMLAVQDWPARINCPKCVKPRVVTRLTCEHCGADQDEPARDGTEILEPADASPVALAGTRVLHSRPVS